MAQSSKKDPGSRKAAKGRTKKSRRVPRIRLYELFARPMDIHSTPEAESKMDLYCGHEAGHAVAAVLHSLSFSSIDVVSDGPRGGGMVADLWDISDRNRITRAMSALLAGSIGADLYLFMKYGIAPPEFMRPRMADLSPGSQVDLVQVESLAREVVPPKKVKGLIADMYSRTVGLFMAPPISMGHYQVTRALIDQRRLTKATIMKILAASPHFPIEGIADHPDNKSPGVK
jgi:hypothetical protein